MSQPFSVRVPNQCYGNMDDLDTVRDRIRTWAKAENVGFVKFTYCIDPEAAEMFMAAVFETERDAVMFKLRWF